jgi:hypothetical protein
MAGLGWRTFTAGAVLTAAQVQAYLQDQVVQVHASSAARSSALGTAVAEGMVSYRTDGKVIERYTGSAWVPVGDNIYATAAARGSVTSVEGQIAYLSTTDATNDTANQLDFYNGSAWESVKTSQNNAVANGDFSKWSRGTSVSPSADTVAYVTDRWSTYRAVANFTVSQQVTGDTTNLPSIQYAARVQRTAATTNTNVINIAHSIETASSIPYAGKQVTVSFYARAGANYSSASNALSFYLASGTGTNQNILNGFTSQTAVFSTVNATLTTTWQRFSATGTVLSSATELGLQLFFTPVGTAGANDYFEFTGVQLEAGTVASPFRPSGGNTALDTATAGSAGFDGVLVSTNSATNPSGSGTPAWAGFDVAGKNKIINGAFDWWQRGTSTAITTVSNTYVVDRWFATLNQRTSGTLTINQNTSQKQTTDNYCVEYDATALVTTSSLDFTQVIETKNVVPLRGQMLTLSFWAKLASSTSTLQAVVRDGTDVDVYPNTSVTQDINTVNLTTSWQKFTVNHIVQSGANSIAVRFSLPNAFAGKLYLSQVQLEAGSVATPFSRAGGTLQGELAACQRYYYRMGGNYYTNFGIGNAWSSVNTNALVFLPVQMRVAPTSLDTSAANTFRVEDGSTATTCTAVPSLDSAYESPTVAFINTYVGSGLTQTRTYRFSANNNTGAYIGFNAEL